VTAVGGPRPSDCDLKAAAQELLVRGPAWSAWQAAPLASSEATAKTDVFTVVMWYSFPKFTYRAARRPIKWVSGPTAFLLVKRGRKQGSPQWRDQRLT
jgi:hypothetical protein